MLSTFRCDGDVKSSKQLDETKRTGDGIYTIASSPCILDLNPSPRGGWDEVHLIWIAAGIYTYCNTTSCGINDVLVYIPERLLCQGSHLEFSRPRRLSLASLRARSSTYI